MAVSVALTAILVSIVILLIQLRCSCTFGYHFIQTN